MAQDIAGTEVEPYRSAAFKYVAMPLMIFDLATRRCVEANSAADQAYGYEASEWEAVSLFDIYDAQSHPLLKVRLDSLGGTRTTLQDDVVQCRRDGECFPALASLALINGKQGRRILLSIQDVTLQRELQSELSLAREHSALVQELTGSGYCIFDLKRGLQSWSEQQCHNLGRQADKVPDADLAGAIEALLGSVREQDRGGAASQIHACIDTGMPIDTEWRVRWPDGTEHILGIEAVRKDDAAGIPYVFVCASLDLTDKRRMEDSLRQSRIDLSLIQQIAQVGTWEVDLVTGRTIATSEETRKILGIDSEVPMSVVNSRIHPDDFPSVETARRYCLENPGTVYQVQYRVIPRPGVLRYVESRAEVQLDVTGKPTRMVGYLHDITEAKLAEQEIQRLAYHCEVTGLPNRMALRRQLERSTFVDAPKFMPLALVVIDVSRFQDICLTVGHSNSDVLLKDVAMRIVSALGEGVHVGRIGNSQFAAILTDAQAYESKAYTRTLLKAFEKPFQVAGIQYDINVNIGIALCPGHASDPGALMRMATVAVFRARQIGTDVLVYQPGDDPYKPERLALLGEFRRAVQEGEIELYCQPKVEMRTNEVIGAEALVRWRHPRQGMISPALFVPLVEDTELIHVLTRHMLHASVRQCFNWRRQGLDVPLAVNISPRNLLSHELVPSLETLLHTWGGSPDWLGLEITESSVITDPEASIAELTTLSRMGFRLFIDDFGTGYSSLSYLTKMPVSVIKVDHGFTMRMLEDKRAAAIVKSTIELAHNLGMTVVAEGTSSKEIWDALIEYGCDEAQGYYVAEPFPAAEFSSWLKASGRRVGVGSHIAPAPAFR